MNVKTILSLSLILLLSGCSTIEPASTYQRDRLASVKSIYVVKHSNSRRSMDLFIQEAIAKRGIRVSSGSIDRKPKNVDAYVRYVDRWKWDISMYLKSLKISIYTNDTDALIASGEFSNSFFHSFPDPDQKAQQVIDSIFEKI